MKKYVTFVRNEAESREVQEALFMAGFKWSTGDKNYTTMHPGFLCIEPAISHSKRICTIADMLTSEGAEAIQAEDIISDPFQLYGAKQPEKMIIVDGKEYSESTIKSALREYVS